VYFPDSEWIDESGDSGGASTTPNFDKVFAAQDITGNARRFVRAMLGRSAYAVGTLDNWHATLFIKGRAGTGKSTLLEHVAAKWHPAGLVGTLGNLSGGVGQYVHILDKELVIVTEIGDTFGGNGFAQTWLKMTEGAFLDFPVPRQPNWEGKWSAPLLHCGNNYFAWPDPLGAVAASILSLRVRMPIPRIGADWVAFLLAHRSRRLQEEFMRKRKKGKLDANATDALKRWWTSHIVWPYPTVRHASVGVDGECISHRLTPRGPQRENYGGHRKSTSRNCVG
jgi:hypothetical protein